MRNVHELSAASTLPGPLERVFAFFSDVSDPSRTTPPELRFAIDPPRPVAPAEGR